MVQDNKMGFEDDLEHPRLTDRDVELLRALRGRRLLYAGQGRPREAHGVGAAMDLVWKALTQPKARLDEPFDTRPSDLDDELRFPPIDPASFG